MKQLIHSFNGGEVSPMTAGRVDLPGMMRSCRLMRNFIAHPVGGAVRRPSLLYVGAAANDNSRLIPFRVGVSGFILELNDQIMKVWDVSSRTVVATLVAPWFIEQVPAVQYAQSNDVMWLVHPEVEPRELLRTSGGWSLQTMLKYPSVSYPYGVWPPLRDVNVSDITLAVADPAVTGVATTMTASAALFDTDMEGGVWEISHYRDAASAELQMAVTAAATALLSMTANPTAGEQFSIGSVVYRWVSGAPTAPYELTIGASASDSKATAKDAINGVSAPSTIGTGTVAHPDVEASDGGSVTTGTSASATLTFLSQLNDGATVTIDGQVYTFKNTLSAAYHVKIGANAQATLDNLILAMDVTGVAGTNYGVGTAAHPTVNARARVGNVATFYARTAGTAGNSIALAHNTGSVSTYGVRWSSAKLSGGTAATTEKLLITARALGEDGNGIEVAETMANGAWSATASDGTLYTDRTAGGTEVDQTSESVSIKGRWNFTTVGRWQGTVYIERENEAGTWEVVRQYIGRLDTNKTDEGIADVQANYRIRVVDYAGEASSDVANPRFILEAVETVVRGLVLIEQVNSSTSADVAVQVALHSADPTPIWREGAFSTHRGFPGAVALHEERLLFGGNEAEPQKVWGSAVGDFRNFEETGLADGSWQWRFSSQQAQKIRWMVSARGLTIGTDLGVRTWDSGESGITPLHPPIQRQLLYNGCKAMMPEAVGDAVLYVQRGGRSLVEYAYEEASGGYVPVEISQLVEHFMLLGGMQYLAVQRVPFTVLWVVTATGVLLSCTYARRDEVVAWARHSVDGIITGVACVPSSDGSTDEVWITVSRSSGDFLERLSPGHLESMAVSTGPLWHLDHAKTASGATVSGLSHLNGQTVKVINLSTGVPVASADQVVSGGAVTVAGATSLAVGLASEPAILQPQLFDFVTDAGTSIGRRFNCKRAHIRFHMSGECKYAANASATYYAIPFTAPGFSGLKSVQVEGNFDDGVGLVLKADGIQSCNVLSIVPEFELYGGR